MGEVFRNLDYSLLTDALYSVVPALLCIIIHELAHGYTAYRLGDDTAKRMGRLTLNPIRHLDAVGLLSMMFLRFGWAKPVPIDPSNFRNPKRGMAISALAGPLSNLLLAVATLFVTGCLFEMLTGSGAGAAVLEVLYRLAVFSVSLAIFNILPIPPMDGSKVFFSFLPDTAYFKLMRYERYGLIFLVLLSLSGRLGGPLGAAVGFVFENFLVFFDAGRGLAAILY